MGWLAGKVIIREGSKGVEARGPAWLVLSKISEKEEEKKLAELNDGLKRGEWARTKRFVESNHLNFFDDQSYICQRYIM